MDAKWIYFLNVFLKTCNNAFSKYDIYMKRFDHKQVWLKYAKYPEIK